MSIHDWLSAVDLHGHVAARIEELGEYYRSCNRYQLRQRRHGIAAKCLLPFFESDYSMSDESFKLMNFEMVVVTMMILYDFDLLSVSLLQCASHTLLFYSYINIKLGKQPRSKEDLVSIGLASRVFRIRTPYSVIQGKENTLHHLDF